VKILLVQVDGKMPNLALMKISRWHKKQGDDVFLQNIRNEPDKVYISCIFSKNKPKALGIAKMFNCQTELGGYGINDAQLPHEIEHTMPDYSLYGVQYSMGYTSRGCIRKCPWCIVPQKEGDIRDNAHFDEFYVPEWRKLILWDNNFLASPKWYQNLKEMIARKVKVSFSQGNDIRLVDQEKARLLAKVHYYDKKFIKRRLYFAFDTPQIESQVIKGIETLVKVGVRREHLMFYELVGHSTTFQEDYHRFEVLTKEGVKPFIMIYNNRKDQPILRHFARWVNKRYYEVCDFPNYKPMKVLNLKT
jgi:hypothetical protein